MYDYMGLIDWKTTEPIATKFCTHIPRDSGSVVCLKNSTYSLTFFHKLFTIYKKAEIRKCTSYYFVYLFILEVNGPTEQRHYKSKICVEIKMYADQNIKLTLVKIMNILKHSLRWFWKLLHFINYILNFLSTFLLFTVIKVYTHAMHF